MSAGQNKTDILGLDSDAFASDAKVRIGKGSGISHELYRRVFARGTMFPPLDGDPVSGAGSAWARYYSVGLLPVAGIADSEGPAGITSKVILSTSDGYYVECVRIPMYGSTPDRATICVSSQIGCRLHCSFCSTGSMGFIRNLSAAEIVSQLVTLRVAFGWNFHNVVFMGMGEPLDNFDAVTQALSVIHDRRGLNFAWDRITLCTSGIVEGIAKLKNLGLKRLGLSVSLNSANDEVRNSIMPVNRSCGLARLASALAEYPQRKNFVLGVNYCLLPGINDSEEDAVAVAAFCSRVGRCLVNLIPYNPGPEPLTRAPREEETAGFISRLEVLGVRVKQRIEKGSSIMAACGQLGAGNQVLTPLPVVPEDTTVMARVDERACH